MFLLYTIRFLVHFNMGAALGGTMTTYLVMYLKILEISPGASFSKENVHEIIPENWILDCHSSSPVNGGGGECCAIKDWGRTNILLLGCSKSHSESCTSNSCFQRR